MNENKKRTKIIANNIRRYLKINGMTQTDLARKINVSKSTLSDYLNLRSAPSYGVIQKIADTFEVNKSDIDSTFKVDTFNSSGTNSTSYNFYNAGLSAGTLQTVDPFTSENTQIIDMPDSLLGKYAGDKDIFISRINGESMNRCIPNESIIAIKKFNSLYELKDGDIVIFQDASEMSIKRFYNDQKNKIISFIPDSSNKDFHPILYRYEDIQQINILGKVVMYTVEL